MSERQRRPGDEYSRYASYTTENGAVVLYDRNDSTAWIESDIVVSLEP